MFGLWSQRVRPIVSWSHAFGQDVMMVGVVVEVSDPMVGREGVRAQAQPLKACPGPTSSS